mgnify:CR=1 FL=1
MAQSGYFVMPPGAGSGVVRVQTQGGGAWRPTQPIDFLVMAGKGGGADLAVQFIIKLIGEKGWSPSRSP